MAPVCIKSVLISESVDPRCRTILEENGIHVTEKQNMRKDELIAEIKNYDGLVVRSATKVTADVIDAATNLKIIGRAGTGVDNVDVDAATQKGIIVMNTPSGNTISAAELTCALIMNLSRQVPQAAMSMKAGNWDRKKTIGYDPITPKEISASWGVEQMTLEQLWPQCDYITVHTPLMPSTVGLLNDETFAKCKRGVKVVNCARGGIIDEAALFRAVESGQCGGAGLDVFVEEPPKERTLVDHPNVISCPHLGASTKEAQARCGQDIALQIVDMVNGKNLVGAVNAQVLASTFSQQSQELIKFGEAIGALLQSCLTSRKPYSNLRITTQGDCMKSSTSYMPSAVLVGLLGNGSNSINLINVLNFAKESGIQVSQTHCSSNGVGVCEVEILADGCTIKATGSVQSGVPVLLTLSDSTFRQPVSLTGNLLFFKASENSQLLLSVVGVLAAEGVQIESFSAPVNHTGEQWFCVGLSKLLTDLNVLKPIVTDAAQVTI
uniref:Phosphoglycerate dehydrogenase n=1 Tax=Neogobius melanostomus TaxID=47308 RepID=A0A8C6WXE7_9GOBI